jgi:predicted RNA-binding protein with PUA-like domain
MVDIKLVKKFSRPLSLDFLKGQAPLKRMELLRKGSRLSVQPVRPEEWKAILKLADD